MSEIRHWLQNNYKFTDIQGFSLTENCIIINVNCHKYKINDLFSYKNLDP